MSSIMEQFAEKFYKEGVEYGTAIGQSRAEMKGRYEAKREAAIAFYKENMPIDMIAKCLKVGTREVETWIEEDMVVAK